MQAGAAPDLAVLIPALNCAATIGDVVRGARRYVDMVLVVSDGSSDATAIQARAAGADVVEHGTTQGKGAALHTGMQRLIERGIARVLTMDGDGEHFSGEIPVLLGVSDSQPEALVIGVRQAKPGSVAPIRGFGNRFANRWVEIACGQALPDTQSGFRIYPLRATLALAVRSRHFGFETEVLIRAARAGLPIRSAPVQVFYPPARERVSQFRPFVDTVRIVLVVVGLILRVW